MSLGSVDSIVEIVPDPPHDARTDGRWHRVGSVLVGVLALVFAWIYPPLGFLLGLAAIVLALLLWHRVGDRRVASIVLTLGSVAVVATCVWALTSLGVHTQGTPGPTPAPAMQSRP